jgi:hypothetical protein
MTTRSHSNYVIIPHSDSARILLLQERDAWTLPRHIEEGSVAINRAIKQALGCEVTILFAVYEYDAEHEDGMATQRIDVLENHSADWQLPAIGRWVSAKDLPELTINMPQNWILMEDAGQVLDEQHPEKAHDLTCWHEIISAYVGLQIEAIGQRDYLLSQGCPDRRLELLPGLFETALADRDMLCVGREGSLTSEELTQLRGLMPRLKARCKELASYGIPETLHHDDLHAGNIMVSGEHSVFFDWAESFIAHPFYSLAIIRRYARSFTSEQLDALGEVYLKPWTAYAPLERLHEAFELARPLGLLCRGLTWYCYLKSLEPGLREKYVLNWPYWLQLFLGAMVS